MITPRKRIMELRRKKRIKRAEAETRLPYIPEGIVVHILAKLPVKSLGFRYVSKNWHSLISDPKFNLYTQRQQIIVMSMPMRQSKYQKSASVHLIDDEASVKELPMPEPLRGALANGGPQLRGSCNGLVLVSYDHDLFLWNPMTGWCNKVLSYWRLGNYKHGLRLFLSGLCYDYSSTDDYKVVTVSRASYFVMVGSCRNKSWTEVHFPHCKGYLESGPTMNDLVHWLVRNREDPCSQIKPYYIVSFDPQMNEFVVVPMPQNERIKGTFVHSFGVLGGCLSMAVSTGHEMYKVTDVEVFAMKKYGDKASWTSLFIISRLIVTNPRYLSLVPLCSTTEGEVLFQREVKRGNYHIQS